MCLYSNSPPEIFLHAEHFKFFTQINTNGGRIACSAVSSNMKKYASAPKYPNAIASIQNSKIIIYMRLMMAKLFKPNPLFELEGFLFIV